MTTSSDIEVYAEPDQSVTLFRTDEPAELVARATTTANALAAVIQRQGLAVSISGGEHVKVEGWTLLGTMLGVFPVLAWSRRIDGIDGWEARVEAHTRSGEVVGAAEAMCTRDEEAWGFAPKGRNGQPLKPRDEFALRSMAQTRATSKALRQPLGFVMTLAGYEATPAEEMPLDGGETAGASRASTAPAESEGTAAPPSSSNLATEAQLKLLHVLIGKLVKLGQDEAAIKDGIYAEYGVTSTKALSKAEISEQITRLKGLTEPLQSDDIPF